MAGIHLLNEDVFRKIAAGEVIERPLSAVKELVENAIDAGAASVRVELSAGGKEMIRVADDGSGFAADEIEIAFQRHSTSKLSELEDLDSLRTLGFRGEALPSILEVADIELSSADNELGHGWHCRFSRGRLQTKEACACRRGSVITVTRLFADFPVRAKFMKSDQGELRPITAFLEATALARPGTALALQHNGRTVFSYPAAASLRERIYQVFGSEFMAGLRPVEHAAGGYRLSGFVSAPGTGVSGKSRQFFVVNGRPIREKTILAAFNNACSSYLEKSRSPAGIITMDIPPAQVDVNIHPMKLEIRFQDSQRVFRFIQEAIGGAMGERTTGRDILGAGREGFPSEAPFPPPRAHEPAERAPGALLPQGFAFSGAPAVGGDDFRVLGQYLDSYIVVEKNGELLIIDQHNARERVLFERLLAGYKGGNAPSAPTLFPLLLELTPAERLALDDAKLEFFKKSGFDVRLLSGSAVEIKAYPQSLAESELRETFRAALQEPLAGDFPDASGKERLLAAMACRDAVKVNNRLQPEQQRALVRDLFACVNPHLCPHRRPIIVTLTLADIEKQLKRR
jgi:DNA mismatch repair protein MutL